MLASLVGDDIGIVRQLLQRLLDEKERGNAEL